MAVVERAKIAAALQRKGFRAADKDHEFWFFYHDNKKTSIHTKLSRGSGYKDYGDDLLRRVRNQLHLTKGQFGEWIECTIDETQYTEILMQQGCLR